MKRNTLPSALCKCAAYIPVYEGGNSVMAVKRDGETVKSVKNRMKAGEIMRDKFSSRIIGELNLKDGILAASSEYSQPATKGDICLLAYELLKIRNLIRDKV